MSDPHSLRDILAGHSTEEGKPLPHSDRLTASLLLAASAAKLSPGGAGGYDPTPDVPHPDMTKEETISFLETLPENLRQSIHDSPDGRKDGEDVDDFFLRMKLKKYVAHTL